MNKTGWRAAAAVLLLGALVFSVYSPTLSYPFANWDDAGYVGENYLIRELSWNNLARIFSEQHFYLYIPLTLLTFSLEYPHYRMEPRGYRLTNITLHGLNAGLVFLLVFGLTRNSFAALGSALVFVLHPVQIESVVWIAERKNVLSAFFFLAAFLFYVRDARGSAISYGTSLVFFAAACFSKPSAVVLPALLALFDATYGQGTRGRWKRYVPYAVIGLAFAVITCLITSGAGKLTYRGGSFYLTMLAMARAMVKYLELLVWPLRQSLLYQFPLYKSPLEPPVLLSSALLAAAAAGLFYLWRRDRKLFFWGAWYFILLAPVSNIIPFPSLMNDRYLYLPLIGFFTLLLLLAELIPPPPARKFARFAGIGLLLFFAVLNLQRQKVWASSEALWGDTQGKTQSLDKLPYLNVGMNYLRANDFPRAIEQFQKLLEIMEEPRAYEGLGLVCLKKGEYPQAVEHLKKASAMMPESAETRHNLALVYQKMGDHTAAVREWETAISLRSDYPKYRNNMAYSLMQTGRYAEAVAQIDEALKIDPDFDDALDNRGVLFFQEKRFSEAEKCLSHLVKVHPDYKLAKEARAMLEQIRQNAVRNAPAS